MHRAALAVAAALAGALYATPAHADDPPAPEDTEDTGILLVPRSSLPPADDDVTTARRVAAIAAAIVPGAVVHGAGAFVLGDRHAAKRLLLMEAVGVAAVGIGAALVQGSRGSEYTVEPGVPLLIAGAGLILPSWFDDIWLATGGDTRPRGTAIGAPPWSLELGTTYQTDAYRRRGLVRAAATVDIGRVGASLGTYFDAEGASRAGDLEVRYLVAGDPARTRALADGSRLSVRAVARYLRDDPDMVSTASIEAEVIGRLDLLHLDPLLAGTFAEVTTGYGLDRVTYSTGAHDHDTLLLGRFAWGMYLGTRGEWTVYYDHRRDGLAGGFDAWHGAGFVGSFGSGATVELGGPWAARADVQFGNAMLTTLALQYRGGQP